MSITTLLVMVLLFLGGAAFYWSARRFGYERAAEAEIARLTAEVGRLQPVVDAACAWVDEYRLDDWLENMDHDSLIEAVDKYRS